MNKKVYTKEIDVAGKKLTLEVNKLAPQANTSVIARYGDTEVLATVVSAAAKLGLGYFPLTVDFIERLYAGGIIKGSRWVKREGRPTDEAILTGRLVDRSIRPLFPKDFMDEVQVTLTLLSTDGENDHDVLSIVAASAALAVSNVPWNGPIGAVRAGYITTPEESIVINPPTSEMEFSDRFFLSMVDAANIIMVEAGAKQLPEEKMTAAVTEAMAENKKIIKAISEMTAEIGQEKYPYTQVVLDQELVNEIEKSYHKDLEPLVFSDDPSSKPKTHQIEELKAAIVAKYPEHKNKNQIPEIVEKIMKKMVRASTMDKKKRYDSRKPDEVRPISAEVGLLPRTHGSGLFQRGLTQVLSVATLASPSLEQWIETAEGMEEKHYLHHYSDPPYALGGTGRLGGLGRREIGHGALAERALLPVIPSQEKFPYTIRVVSEVLSSNGSTSMGSTCGSTLALMDAGVPISAPVSGVAMGIMAKDEKDYVILTDIAAFEDFYGNMDFKVAGTETGITALQLDVKLDAGFSGLTLEMIPKIFAQARDGRMFIMEKMLAVLPASRKNVSQYAPKVVTIKVPVDKIGEVIGPGGRNIKNIIATTTASVDIEDDGTVTIASINEEAVARAKEWIEGMTREVQVGEEFDGEVKRILNFGAFVEILPGKEGLVHVSRMTAGFVSDPNTVVKIGDKVKVKVTEIDEMGRINLAMYWGPKEMGNLPGRQAGVQSPMGNRPRFGGPRPYRPGSFGARRNRY
ncbi:polyribonucleotide nucleotidyltransferase [Patescibacteria group bacterium]|nr:polyribonucleotide nucleotidyltransferase [Patescibacteria group bacterium]